MNAFPRVFQGLAIAVAVLFPLATDAAGPRLDPLADAYPRSANEFSAAVIIDSASGKELYVYHPDKAWTPASITKLLSALVVTEQKPKWTKSATIKKADEVGGGRLRVADGSRMTLRDLLFSSIVGSANNAAMALARSTGLGMKTFVARMNQTAKRLQMTSSHFVDVSGMSPNNVSTARDIAKLATAAFANKYIGEAATTASYHFVLQSPKIGHTVKNTNHLLTSDPTVYVYGGKTGYLEESLNNLAVKLERNPKSPSSPPLLVVVFGAPDKDHLFASAKALAEWAWTAYEW